MFLKRAYVPCQLETNEDLKNHCMAAAVEQPEMLPAHIDMPVCAGSMAMCILRS